MPIDFRYVPQSSEPISGVAVLRQTETAINELGAETDRSNAAAGEALNTANSALSAANDALASANIAQTGAQNAIDRVSALTPRVSAVEIAAQDALNLASTAYDNAAIADAGAVSAQASADNAQAVADTALSKAVAAQASADSAQSSVDGAINIAERAQGIYLTDDADGLDANDFYDTAVRVYITGAGILNFPSELTGPLWFDVYLTDDSRNVLQYCRNDTADLVYTRSGTVTAGDMDDSAVAWGPWHSSGGSAGRLDLTLDAPLAAGTYFSVPAYTVGSNKLRVEYEGISCRPGPEGTYQEVGTSGELSSGIIFNVDLPAGSELTVIAAH